MSNHKKVKRLQVKGRPSTAHSYFSFGPSETPVPLPQLPAWMLETPMYSKLPMVPAPKGKIVLYTTGLGKKLHHTLSELEFEPNPQELSTEYHSLHDKHLRSYYCKPAKISRLIRNGFITPEGKVICTLKEFNDYQQHLKRVRLEKDTQERKQLTAEEREDRERMRWSRPKTSYQLEHEQRAEDALARHKKITTDRHKKIIQQQHERELKRIRLHEEKRRSHELELARKEKEQERLRSHKIKLFKEEWRRKTAYVRKRSDEERKRAIKLQLRRKAIKDSREKQLETRWEQKIQFKELQEKQESLQKEQESRDMEEKIEAREMVADVQYRRQKATFHKICESQAIEKAEKEEKIRRHLENKHRKIRTKYEHKRKQISAKYKRAGTQHAQCFGQMKKQHHYPMRSSEWEITACILVDICGEIADESIDLSSSKSTLEKRSSQELPAVRRSGSGRTLSWHESMNDLSSKERLPPITRSRLFNEEDEEMYAIDNRTPKSSTSDVSDAILDEKENEFANGVCAPVIEVQLEEAIQDRSLEFTEDDYKHFMEMGSVDNIDSHTPSTTPGETDKRSKSPVPGESPHVGMSKSDVINGLREAFPSPLPPEGLVERDTEEDLLAQLEQGKGSSETGEREDDGFETLVRMTSLSKAFAIVQNAVRNAISTIKGQDECYTRKPPALEDHITEQTVITKKGVNPDEESIYSIESTTPNYGDDILSARAVEIECTIDGKTFDDIPEEIDDRCGADDTSKLADDTQGLPDDIPEELPEAEDTTTNYADDHDQVEEEIAEEINDTTDGYYEVNQGSSVDYQEEASKEINDPSDEHSQALQTSSEDHQNEIREEISEEKKEIIENSENIPDVIHAKVSGLFCDDDSESSDHEDETGYSLYQPSSILQSLMDIFGDSPPGEFRSSSEGEESEEDEVEDDDEEEIIGFLENPNIAEETGVSFVSDAMTKERPFTEVVSVSGENRVIVEGAIRRASSGDFVGHRGSITEAVLSIQNLSRDSSKRLVLEKVSGKVKSSTGDNDMKGADKLKDRFVPEEHYHQIIPLYHNHAVDVGQDLIDSNLSAISMKPDSHRSLSESVHTASRNSFRNIFRPDLTYCEGSAKCLRKTLLRQVSHSSSSSPSGSSHANMMSVLDQSHHDVTAHHSDEEIVHTDDAGGVCMRPMTRSFKVHHVIDDVVKEQDEADENQLQKVGAICNEIVAGNIEKVNLISEENVENVQENVKQISEQKSKVTNEDAPIETQSIGDKITKNDQTAVGNTNNDTSVVEDGYLDDRVTLNQTPKEDIIGNNGARVPDSIELKSSDSNFVKLVQLEESNSGTDFETKEAEKIGSNEVNSNIEDVQKTNKTKGRKVKTSQRRLGASHSLTGCRPRSSKHHEISQSKSAYSSSSKHLSKISLKSKVSGAVDGRKQSSSKNSSDSTSSSSSLMKEHSIILVQPAQEQRSSCTVILTDKRSSQMSAKSSTKDLKTPDGAEGEERHSSMTGCDKESPEDDKKVTSIEADSEDLEKYGRRHSSRIRPAKSLSPSSSTGITYKKKIKTGRSENTSDNAEDEEEKNTEN